MFLGAPAPPIFAALIILHLAEDTERRARDYFRNLLLWAVPAQLPYAALRQEFAPFWSANVLFTLLIGVALCLAWYRRQWWALAIVAGGDCIANGIIDGGAIAPLGMVATFVLTRLRHRILPGALLGMCLGNLLLDIWKYRDFLNILWHMAGFALVPLLYFLAEKMPWTLPRPPRMFFYAYYPAHLGIIWAVAGPYDITRW